MDIKDKLNTKLKEISYARRFAYSMTLNDGDIVEIFDCLSKHDPETKPLLESMKVMCLNCEDKILVEDQIKSILKYFNIIENYNITNCRHMFLFNESRKLVKTKLFNDDKLLVIKNMLNERKIFEKLEVSDEI